MHLFCTFIIPFFLIPIGLNVKQNFSLVYGNFYLLLFGFQLINPFETYRVNLAAYKVSKYQVSIEPENFTKS